MLALLTVLGALLSFALPEAAEAHNAFGDMGGFNNGFLHPVTTLPHILLLVALGIMLILNRQKGDYAIGGFLIAFCVGYVTSVTVHPVEWVAALAVLVAAMGLAITTVIGKPLRTDLLVSFAATGGLIVGMDTDGAAVGLSQHAVFVLGALASLTMVQVYFLFAGMAVRKPWQIVALRIAASWLTTIALLTIAVMFKAK